MDKAGPENTENILRIAKKEVINKGINHVVLASTYGDTALKAIEVFDKIDINLIVVTHNTGFNREGEQQFNLDIKKKIEDFGGIVYTGTMVLRGIGKAIKLKMGYSQEELVANTLRMFGQGIKVCVEIVAMAADAGLIPFDDVIAIAGTARGADTLAIIKANSSNRFFDIRVREIIKKPFLF
jgi:hypothetical protein